MFVIITISLAIGLLVLAITWSSVGFWAFLLAPTVASVSGLFTSFILARLRKDKHASTPTHTEIQEAAISARAATNPKRLEPSDIGKRA